MLNHAIVGAACGAAMFQGTLSARTRIHLFHDEGHGGCSSRVKTFDMDEDPHWFLRNISFFNFCIFEIVLNLLQGTDNV